MLHTKFLGNRPSDSREKVFNVFTIHEHGGHICDVTWTNNANFNFPIL